MKNKWYSVKGVPFTLRDLANWGESDYLTFLQFYAVFTKTTDEGTKYSPTQAAWLKAHEFLKDENHPFNEFLYRIDYFPTNAEASFRKFFTKFMFMWTRVLKYIQKNPSLVTDNMRAFIEKYPGIAWSLKQVEVVETKLGIEVVKGQNPTVASVEEKTATAAYKVVNFLERLVDSIDDKDIKKLSVRDRATIASRLVPAIAALKGVKVGTQIFNQINIHSQSREELEASLLAVSRRE